MRLLVFMALLQTYACYGLSRPRSVNLNLETVVEFDNNDNSADAKIIDKVRNFLDRVKYVIDKNKDYRRSLKSGKLKFTDFLKHVLSILSSYEDSDLEDVISVVDDEIRKYHYKGCKFHELMENINVRRFMADNLEKVKNAPVKEVKVQMKKMLKTFEKNNFGFIEKLAMDYLNSFYSVKSEDKFRDVLGKLATYRRRTKRSNLNLVEVVRDGIRSLIFDQYSRLDHNTRRDLRVKLETFWQNFIHPENNQHQVWNFLPMKINTNRPNENFKAKDNVDSTSIEMHPSTKKPKRSRHDQTRNAKRQRDKHSTRRPITFLTTYPEHITLLEKRKHKKKSTKSVQPTMNMRNDRPQSKSKNKKKRKAIRKIISEHDAVINVERQTVGHSFPAYKKLINYKSRQMSETTKKPSRMMPKSSHAVSFEKTVNKKHKKIRRKQERVIKTQSFESEEGLSISFEDSDFVTKSFRKSNLNDTLILNNTSIVMRNDTGNITSSSIPPDGNVIKRIDDLEKELKVVQEQMKVTKSDSHERTYFEPIDFWEGTTKDVNRTNTTESTTETTTARITTTTTAPTTKTTTVATTTELTTEVVNNAIGPVFRSQDTNDNEIPVKKISVKPYKELSQNKITNLKEDTQRNITRVKSKLPASFEVSLKPAHPKIDDYNDIKEPEMNLTGIEDIERYLKESKPLGDEKTHHIVRKKMLEQLKVALTDPYGTTGTLTLKWDPKNLEIRTTSVERTLEPLVLQVTTLVNSKDKAAKKKRPGKSKRASALVATVERATEIFIERGQTIAYENPEITQEMLAAVEEVRKAGAAMSVAAREFSEQPCASAARSAMVRAARALLSAVTRLLILADLVDVHLLLARLRTVENDLDKLKSASSQSELVESARQFGRSADELAAQAAKRQHELKEPVMKDSLAAARAVLKKHSTMLLTASKVYVRHPELAAAKANRDYVLRAVCSAVDTISCVAQGRPTPPSGGNRPPVEGPGELAQALDDFDERMVMEPLAYSEVRTRPSLEERLESIISGAALMADSACTRDERRERIVAECNAVRQALQDLLHEYMTNAGKPAQSEGLERAIEHMCRKTRDLRRQLRKAVVDHVSDSFLETNVPLLVLMEAARGGNEKEVEEYALVFTEHANKLVEVANLVCSMSNNEDGVKMVRHAAAQIEALCPQVINAARVLAARPRSRVAQENATAFARAWEAGVKLLTEAVDDITTIDDFLAVSENHILEDVNKCVVALQEGDPDSLERTAGAIRGRANRVCSVVTQEMDNYEPCIYTKRVLEAVTVLRDQVMSKFAVRVDAAVSALGGGAGAALDENDFIDASRLVYDAVREIRRAVLMNRTSDDLDTDTEFEPVEDMTMETRSRSSAHTGEHGVDEYPDISGITNAREAMRKMTEEDKRKILQQVELFRREKMTFDNEVAKWDDAGNDIIMLAKHMCMIMLEMTDFTRGRGPLKTTMDVINAAKKISEAGTKLDKLTREIAEQCPESSTKQDLLAYLQRIALYCHQIQITSKVKADVQNISGELIVSGLDSATSLIQAAKNLMNAVVLTVKASYVASTKYTRQGTIASPIVVWRMKAPEKKPLIRPEKPEEVRAKVRRGSQKKQPSPVHALAEFQSPAESV